MPEDYQLVSINAVGRETVAFDAAATQQSSLSVGRRERTLGPPGRLRMPADIALNGEGGK